MKFVCLSDTHCLHGQFKIPDGDVLLHAGDFTMIGKEDKITDFSNFLGSLPHEYKVVIAGNHDLLFEKNPTQAQALLKNCIYLEDSFVEIEGIKIYGSPWQPWFFDWAFNLQRGEEIKAKWDLIPADTDVLVTHGGPWGHGDVVEGKGSQGCEDLLNRIRNLKIKYHIFGHIHEGYGITKEGMTTCINASNVDVKYAPINIPIVFEL